MTEPIDNYPHDTDRKHMEPEYESTSPYLFLGLAIVALAFWLAIAHMEIYWWQQTAHGIKPQVVIDKKTICEFSINGDYVILHNFFLDNCTLYLEEGAEHVTVIGGLIENSKHKGIVVRGASDTTSVGNVLIHSNPGMAFKELSPEEFEKKYPKVPK